MGKKNSATIPDGRKGAPARAAADAATVDTSDDALATLLKRLKTTADPAEIRRLSDQIERVVFHKQFTNA
jgi:hypothetical protein